MARKDIVVVGASAGGMEALQKLVSHLPPDLPAALFIVWHLSPGAKSMLPQILSKSGPLKAVHPQDGDPIEPGRISASRAGRRKTVFARRGIRCSARRRTSTGRGPSAWC